ncbi:MAG: molybdopterin molybdotransferase MoeA [Planctomycetes bacterium]|nr:molybdopterin molybdotransferase MoeA [Planctomycetota bacterium]
MASPHEAVEAVRERLPALGTELVDLSRATGRVLAEPLLADRESPALDVSSMDGFAVRMEDLAAMASRDGLPVATGVDHEASIGHAPVAMRAGHAVRIVTGAPIPLGADAVVRYEDVTPSDGRVRLTIAPAAIKGGANIRRRGENAAGGARLANPGMVLSAAVIGGLAAFGKARVRVHRRVRVALVVTGDELVAANAAPQPWQVRDSNGPVLESLFGARPWIEMVSQSHVKDDEDALVTIVGAMMQSADAVILTGGVSMGHRDHVPGVAVRLGADAIFHKIPQRPGRPMLAALRPGKDSPCLILGLPGNPVSVMVTARRLAVPMLGKFAGLADSQLAPVKRSVANCDDATLSLWWHRLVGERADANGCGELHLLAGKSSGDIASAATSVGFVEVPPGEQTHGPLPFHAWMH